MTSYGSVRIFCGLPGVHQNAAKPSGSRELSYVSEKRSRVRYMQAGQQIGSIRQIYLSSIGTESHLSVQVVNTR
jgi:hypothetical protein